jgi:hypothetical protein
VASAGIDNDSTLFNARMHSRPDVLDALEERQLGAQKRWISAFARPSDTWRRRHRRVTASLRPADSRGTAGITGSHRSTVDAVNARGWPREDTVDRSRQRRRVRDDRGACVAGLPPPQISGAVVDAEGSRRHTGATTLAGYVVKRTKLAPLAAVGARGTSTIDTPPSRMSSRRSVVQAA